MNELKALFARRPDLADPAFFTLACAGVGSSASISWEFPQPWRSPDDNLPMVGFLIDWAAKHRAPEILPAVISLVLARATALKRTADAAELDTLLNQACSASKVSREAAEGACIRLGKLDFAGRPEAVLLTNFERLPPPGVRRAMIQWPGGYKELGNLQAGEPESLIEDARNCLGDSPELAVFPLRRIEAFSDPEDVNRPWERRKNLAVHGLPVVVRLNRSAVDRNDLVAAPTKICSGHVPCRIGPAGTFTQPVEQVGFFFAASTSNEDGVDWLTGAVCSASAGLWLREPVKPEEAERVLLEIDNANLSDLPDLVHLRRKAPDRSPWHNAALLFERRDNGFPRRSDRQRKTNHQLA